MRSGTSGRTSRNGSQPSQTVSRYFTGASASNMHITSQMAYLQNAAVRNMPAVPSRAPSGLWQPSPQQNTLPSVQYGANSTTVYPVQPGSSSLPHEQTRGRNLPQQPSYGTAGVNIDDAGFNDLYQPMSSSSQSWLRPLEQLQPSYGQYQHPLSQASGQGSNALRAGRNCTANFNKSLSIRTTRILIRTISSSIPHSICTAICETLARSL